MNQHEVFLGLTNTVLLWRALEYSEICVDRILFCLRPTSGFINKFKLKCVSLWLVPVVVWFRACRQSMDEYCEVLRILFQGICGGLQVRGYCTLACLIGQFVPYCCEVIILSVVGAGARPSQPGRFACRLAVLLFALSLEVLLIKLYKTKELYIQEILKRNIRPLVSIDKKGEVVDLGISVNMVHNRLKFGSRLCLHDISCKMLNNLNLIIIVWDLSLLLAYLFILVANNFDTSLPVGAEQGQASWHNNDRISTNNVSFCSCQSNKVKEGSPILVSNSGGPKSNNFDCFENSLMVDINKGDNSQTSSKTYTSNDKVIKLSLQFDFSKISENIQLDFLPHVVVSLLDFAFVTSVLILNLKGIEDVLPDIESCIGIPESKDNKSRVNTDNTLDVNCLLLYDMGMDRLVRSIAHFASPIDQIGLIISAHNQGVSQGHLVLVGEGHNQIGKEAENKCCFHD